MNNVLKKFAYWKETSTSKFKYASSECGGGSCGSGACSTSCSGSGCDND